MITDDLRQRHERRQVPDLSNVLLGILLAADGTANFVRDLLGEDAVAQ
jgi:hypothetical protein